MSRHSTLAFVMAALVGLAAAACGGGGVTSSGAARWVTHGVAAGVSIDTLAAWSFNGDPVPGLVFPPTLFAAGTGAVPAGGHCGPTAAIKSLSAGGALIALTEYRGRVGQPYPFPPRPARFEFGRPGGPFECWGVRTHRIVFEDGGRYFDVHVVFGQDAPDSLRDEVRRSLDSLEVDPPPVGEQRAAKCAAGQWTACPEAAWVYEVIKEAQVSHLGNRDDEAILGLDEKRSFALWTTPSMPDAPPGASCGRVAGTEPCVVGDRIYVQIQGVRLWIEPAASPYASLRTEATLPDGATLDRLIRAAQSVPLAVAGGAKR